MITIRPAGERGHANHGWLDTHHTFSFADYHDPKHMGFRTLRVLNEDRVQPGQGFGAHSHQDMEIVTYVLEGALQHRDSLGNGSIIRPGEVQRMSAGTGVVHSEFNPSRTEPVRFLQIWILPARNGGPPGYEQKRFETEMRRGELQLMASPDGAGGSLTIHQDARIFSAILDPKQRVRHELAKGRHAWVQIANGMIELNGRALSAGDGAAAGDERRLELAGREPAELLVFDLA